MIIGAYLLEQNQFITRTTLC